MTASAFAPHDHQDCVQSALKRAEDLAKDKGLRLTPVRRRTLEILLERHGAMGAYEVLERLAEDGFGHQPPVAYRALDFLVENGLAHRIRRLNAFLACAHPGHQAGAVFLICRGCDGVAEMPGDAVRAPLTAHAKAQGFAVERASIEALGLCETCAQAEQTAQAQP